MIVIFLLFYLLYVLLDGESLKKRYNVTLTEINELFPPTDPVAWCDLDLTLLRAFDTSLFSYARWQQVAILVYVCIVVTINVLLISRLHIHSNIHSYIHTYIHTYM